MPAPARNNPVPLIIFVVLFVFATIGLVLVSIELSKAKQQMNEGFNPLMPDAAKYDNLAGLKEALMKADQKAHALDEELIKYQKVTGFMTATALEQGRDALYQRLGKIESGAGQPSAAENRSLIAFIERLDNEKLLIQKAAERDHAAAEEARKKFQADLAAEEAKNTETKKLVDDLNARIDDLKAKYSQLESGKRTEVAQAKAERDLIQANKEKEAKAFQEEIYRLNRYIDELKIRLGEQKRLKTTGGTTFDEDTAPIDGKVILVDSLTGVVIDIGQKKGVRRGLKFKVFSLKADGSRVIRGNIEVKTVLPDISRATFEDGKDPVGVVSVGDVIVNPAFDPGRARIFVADTTFDAAKKQAFRDALKEYGSILEDELTGRTDYLIISSSGGPAKSELMQKAEQVGVVLIREDELNRFLHGQ